MKLDIYNKIALIFFSLWISFTVTAAYAGQWNDKPVMCEQKEEFETVMVQRGEILFSQGEMLATVRTKEGLSDIPAILPLRIYINPQKKTFTVAEFHRDHNTVCVLAFGNNYSTLGVSS